MTDKIFLYLIQKIESYKVKNKKTYSKIADEIGISRNSFANLRLDWRNKRGFPNKVTREKLKKIGIFF